MKTKTVSIIVPVYKGEKFIRKNLEVMKKTLAWNFPNFEIVVIIDGNNDNSYNEAMKVKGVKVYKYDINKGKGYALKYGFDFCSGDYITFMDADLDLPPKQISNFIPYMETADIVIGSKRHPFSRLNYPFARKVLSQCFSLYSKLILGVSLRDTQSGLKLMKREVLEVLLPLITIKRFAFDLELMFLAEKHNFRTVEAPLSINFQGVGTGLNIKSIFTMLKGMFLDVLGIRYRYTITKYYQKKYHEVHFDKDLNARVA
jgi:glycosyltransferase involved in cell wall biosynthesis